MMAPRTCYILLLSLFTIACSKDESRQESIDTNAYLDLWTWVYEGSSRHFHSSPRQVNGQWQTVQTETWKDVEVLVSRSDQDSSLNLQITYNQTDVEYRNDPQFSAEGRHLSEWSGGSGYGRLEIRFEADFLHYNYRQSGGMASTSTVNFQLARK